MIQSIEQRAKNLIYAAFDIDNEITKLLRLELNNQTASSEYKKAVVSYKNFCCTLMGLLNNGDLTKAQYDYLIEIIDRNRGDNNSPIIVELIERIQRMSCEQECKRQKAVTPKTKGSALREKIFAEEFLHFCFEEDLFIQFLCKLANLTDRDSKYRRLEINTKYYYLSKFPTLSAIAFHESNKTRRVQGEIPLLSTEFIKDNEQLPLKVVENANESALLKYAYDAINNMLDSRKMMPTTGNDVYYQLLLETILEIAESGTKGAIYRYFYDKSAYSNYQVGIDIIQAIFINQRKKDKDHSYCVLPVGTIEN